MVCFSTFSIVSGLPQALRPMGLSTSLRCLLPAESGLAIAESIVSTPTTQS